MIRTELKYISTQSARIAFELYCTVDVFVLWISLLFTCTYSQSMVNSIWTHKRNKRNTSIDNNSLSAADRNITQNKSQLRTRNLQNETNVKKKHAHNHIWTATDHVNVASHVRVGVCAFSFYSFFVYHFHTRVDLREQTKNCLGSIKFWIAWLVDWKRPRNFNLFLINNVSR